MDDERPFRLHPRRPRPARDESKIWARSFQQLMHLVRMTTRPFRVRPSGSSSRAGHGARTNRFHRCAVRVTYSRNKIRGQWAAHGRYIVRESATALNPDGPASFYSQRDAAPIPELLSRWQKAGDGNVFKIILSPEFGERLDMERLTRDVIAGMEQDLGTRLEWAAAIHRNTEHPHVHVVLRGVAEGKSLRLHRDYVQHGIRRRSEDACTAQLGYRTALDMEDAERREVNQGRYTSLDRVLARRMPPNLAATSTFEVSAQPDNPYLSEFARAREQRLVARLNYLSEIGLAESGGPLTWTVHQNFASALRTFQRAQDRQKMLARYSSFLSDSRLQFRVVGPDTPAEISGRVIGHVLDEVSDRPHALIEGVDGIAYYVPHDDAIMRARANGQLQVNAFVQLRTDTAPSGGAMRTVEDFGDAEQILSDRQYLRSAVRRLVQRGILDSPSQRWSGWLGRYQAAIGRERDTLSRERPREREMAR